MLPSCENPGKMFSAIDARVGRKGEKPRRAERERGARSGVWICTPTDVSRGLLFGVRCLWRVWCWANGGLGIRTTDMLVGGRDKGEDALMCCVSWLRA